MSPSVFHRTTKTLLAARILIAGLCGWVAVGQCWAQGATFTTRKVRITQQYEMAAGEAGKLPFPIRFSSADYPVERMCQGYSGRALVECSVLPDGSVAAIKVTQATEPDFAEAAQAAVADWRFRPYSPPAGKRPADVRLVCSFTFELPDED
jgi:TonB family protein